MRHLGQDRDAAAVVVCISLTQKNPAFCVMIGWLFRLLCDNWLVVQFRLDYYPIKALGERRGDKNSLLVSETLVEL